MRNSEAKLIHEKFEALKSILETRELLSWNEGELWNYLKTGGAFKKVFGEGATDTWKSFVAQVGIPISTVEFKIALYKKYVVELGFTPKELGGANTRKLHRAIPYAKTRADGERIISLASALSFSDFLAELTGQEPCEHEMEEQSVRVCKKCSKKVS